MFLAQSVDMTITVLQVGPKDHVICALSGGVDSTVAATLVHQVLGDRLHCVFVDNGLLRYKVQSHTSPPCRARAATLEAFLCEHLACKHAPDTTLLDDLMTLQS